eukprot:TRINITY_DN2804_c0_g1_i1.p1 TRINITY_DN2804_c0_g1~~TRINITY_DN2804_c0_g1_i1.p1  ORF type:complete len:699 (-),score=64.68 TRINITY_DN2804_c0_g1_i1:75-2171(-)
MVPLVLLPSSSPSSPPSPSPTSTSKEGVSLRITHLLFWVSLLLLFVESSAETIDCTGTKCSNEILEFPCPSGNCTIDCTGSLACSRALISCGSLDNAHATGSSCTVICDSPLACTLLTLSCYTAECDVQCGVSSCLAISLVPFTHESNSVANPQYNLYCNGFFSCHTGDEWIASHYSPYNKCQGDATCALFGSFDFFASHDYVDGYNAVTNERLSLVVSLMRSFFADLPDGTQYLDIDNAVTTFEGFEILLASEAPELDKRFPEILLEMLQELYVGDLVYEAPYDQFMLGLPTVQRTSPLSISVKVPGTAHIKTLMKNAFQHVSGIDYLSISVEGSSFDILMRVTGPNNTYSIESSPFPYTDLANELKATLFFREVLSRVVLCPPEYVTNIRTSIEFKDYVDVDGVEHFQAPYISQHADVPDNSLCAPPRPFFGAWCDPVHHIWMSYPDTGVLNNSNDYTKIVFLDDIIHSSTPTINKGSFAVSQAHLNVAGSDFDVTESLDIQSGSAFAAFDSHVSVIEDVSVGNAVFSVSNSSVIDIGKDLILSSQSKFSVDGTSTITIGGCVTLNGQLDLSDVTEQQLKNGISVLSYENCPDGHIGEFSEYDTTGRHLSFEYDITNAGGLVRVFSFGDNAFEVEGSSSGTLPVGIIAVIIIAVVLVIIAVGLIYIKFVNPALWTKIFSFRDRSSMYQIEEAPAGQ